MQIALAFNHAAVAGFQEFITNPTVEFVIALIGISIGVVSLVWARRFRVNPRMVYQMHDYFVVGQPDVSALGDIKILFNGDPVPRVVVTQLAVWNAGNKTVRRDDIVESDPLAISIDPKSSIVGTGKLNETRSVNEFHIRVMQKNLCRAFLEFDYLDAGDGAVFQIIHSGAKDTAKVTGSLRGIPRGLENWGDLKEWSEQKSRFSNLIPMLTFAVVVGVISWIRSLVVTHYPAATKWFEWMLGAFLSFWVLTVVIGVGVFVIHSFRAGSRAAPKRLSRK